jgi:SAM-dependent methyltransferase
MPPELADHPDRRRWNERYAGREPEFTPHPLAVAALDLLPARGLGPGGGPVLELASGPSGSALLAAERGYRVTAVDVSDVGLGQLADEAGRRGLADRLTLVQADVTTFQLAPACYSMILCTGYWDRPAFGRAARAVAPGGLLAWEALTSRARELRPGLPAEWCLAPGEPAALLPASLAVLEQEDLPGHGGLPRRRMLAGSSAGI